MGIDMVSSKTIVEKNKRARNLAVTTDNSIIGRDKRTSIVLIRFSSAKILIAKAGININKSQGKSSKKGLIDESPRKKRSLINKKLAKAANKTPII